MVGLFQIPAIGPCVGQFSRRVPRAMGPDFRDCEKTNRSGLDNLADPGASGANENMICYSKSMQKYFYKDADNKHYMSAAHTLSRAPVRARFQG